MKTDNAEMIVVRSKKVIILHWFNALCWLLLVASGFGIISGDFVRLAPAFWPTWLQNVFGGNHNLIWSHGTVGLIWLGVFVVFILFNLRTVVIPFLREVLVLTPWAAFKDAKSMTITLAHLFGWAKRVPVPPQGRYNGAQRLLGTMIIMASLAIAGSGLYLFFGPQWLNFSENPLYGLLFRVALVTHASSVFLVLFGLIAHIYFAVVEEPESLEAMKSGKMSLDFIKHHNALWYETLKQEGIK